MSHFRLTLLHSVHAKKCCHLAQGQHTNKLTNRQTRAARSHNPNPLVVPYTCHLKPTQLQSHKIWMFLVPSNDNVLWKATSVHAELSAAWNQMGTAEISTNWNRTGRQRNEDQFEAPPSGVAQNGITLAILNEFNRDWDFSWAIPQSTRDGKVSREIIENKELEQSRLWRLDT